MSPDPQATEALAMLEQQRRAALMETLTAGLPAAMAFLAWRAVTRQRRQLLAMLQEAELSDSPEEAATEGELAAVDTDDGDDGD